MIFTTIELIIMFVVEEKFHRLEAIIFLLLGVFLATKCWIFMVIAMFIQIVAWIFEGMDQAIYETKIIPMGDTESAHRGRATD